MSRYRCLPNAESAAPFRRAAKLGALLPTLAAFCLSTFTTLRAENPLTPADLREDFSILRQALERGHPGLSRYATPKELAAAFAEVDAAITSPLTEVRFLREIAGLLAVVRDDHTYALPSEAFWKNHVGPTIYTQKSTDGDLNQFPFFIKVTDGRVFITHNNSANADIVRGTEILRINSRPAADVVKTIQRLMPTSGFTSTFRPAHLEQFSPQQEYNFFCLYYALFVEAPAAFDLELRGPVEPNSRNVSVPAVRAAELWTNFRSRYVGTKDALLARERPITLAFPAPNVAQLTLTSFHDWRWRRDKLDFQKELARVFTTIAEKQVKHLILDLRGNEGGSAAMTVEVLSLLATAAFQVYAYKEMTDYRFPEFAPYLRNPRGLDHFKPELFEPAPGGRIRIITSLPDETWSRPLDPSPQAYRGRLYVLIDGATGSAAAQLATLLRVNRRAAIFFGEESGGDMEGPVSGSYLELSLPHSGIRVDVPVLKKALHLDGYPNQRGRGVIPDHIITWTQHDIATASDPVIRSVLENIEHAK